MQYELVAIGDTVVDAFIKLKDASVNCDINRENCQICMKFADKIPYEFAVEIPAVGNSANAAVCAARLGLTSALVANVGGDRFGEECLAALKAERVGTDFVKVHPDQKTNYHYVLWYEDDRTILVKHEAYDHTLPDVGEPKWIYLSSLGENTLPFHDSIAEYLKAKPGIKLAFQPGTFQIKLGAEALAGIYARTDVFFCNKEEAQRILKSAEEEDMGALIEGIHGLGPKMVVVTEGTRGATVSSEGKRWFMPSYPDPKPPYERTGAGDAFSATFISALALGLDVPTALSWAPINSMSVVQKIGAQEGLLNRPELEKYLAHAPAEYVPKQIE